MVEHDSSVHGSSSAPYDGRFGRQFDDEINTKGVLQVTLVLGGLCALAMILMIVFNGFLLDRIEERSPQVSPLIDLTAVEKPVEERFPSGQPALQASPEAELEAMREEQRAELEGYGWIDEGAGIVRVPIEVAIDLVLAEGLGAGEPIPAETEAEGTTAPEGEVP